MSESRHPNFFGSYTKLLNNAKQAMLCAIEIYNNPQIEYREEVFIILLINAWELLLKAILSKNHVRIYKPKKRGEIYKTLDFLDVIGKCQKFLPHDIDYNSTRENLELLYEYRNNIIHHYSDDELPVKSHFSCKNTHG